MIHAAVLFLILVILMPYAGWIPMPTIAAILFMVAYNMCQWRTFVHLVKTAPKSDIAVLVITFVLTVAFDLVVAIEIGMLLACLLFMKRMSDETELKGWRYIEQLSEKERAADAATLRKVPAHIRVYELSGPLFFGAADIIERITVKDVTKCLILRMRAVPSIDITAMNTLIALQKRCAKKGITLVLSHVNEQPMRAMKKAGFVQMIGKENICPNIDAAIAHAERITKQ